MSFSTVEIVFQIIAFLFAISVHESAHAWTAFRRGDPTAYMLGRVTLNPIKHIDPIGTILLPIIAALTHFPLIGWAKPTPVNPRNFKNPVLDDILTSVAGPVSNFIVVVSSVTLMLLIGKTSDLGNVVVRGLANQTLVDAGVITPIVFLLYEFMYINILLGIFNLIPVPPLDGSHVLRHFLSGQALRAYDRLGMFGLIFLMLVGGRVLGFFMYPVVGFFQGILKRV
jgi:Zn-dependent protease